MQQCPQTVLFEAIQTELSGKRILNDSERRRDRDFGQGGFLSKRRDRDLQSSQTEISSDNPCSQQLSGKGSFPHANFPAVDL
jgi:hypothetical protein